MSILEVHDVSIRYMTGDFKDIGLKEYILRNLKGNYHINEFWADKNISFSLEKGDMLGIIGTNGAGKSTLLKVVSGIMAPTAGSVNRSGTIAALLELASGFDGDLTVRENTYLRGAMLGYTRKFMDETYEQIIEFAELKDFQDRPFKQLSSGMKSRLAFSIASLVQPDILILDEVLSVGDGAFRKKSETKMREIIDGGATTILVSHSLEQIRTMCTKVLWLNKGEQVAFGSNVEEICDQYQEFLEGKGEPIKSGGGAQSIKIKANACPKGTPRQKNALGFDLLRIILALMVYFFHININLGFTTPFLTIDHIISLGAVCMVGFFMLSGFTLAAKYGETGLLDKNDLKCFYKKRIRRIYPSYCVFLLVIFLFRCSFPQKTSLLLLLIPIDVLGLQAHFPNAFYYIGNGGTWFISVLLFLYLIFPFLLQFVKNTTWNKGKLLFLCYIAAVYVGVLRIFLGGDFSQYYANPIYRVPEFLIGIILADIEGRRDRHHMSLSKQIVLCILYAGIYCGGIRMLFDVQIGETAFFKQNYLSYNILIVPLFAAVILTLSKDVPVTGFRRVRNIIHFMGQLSFPFYLTQTFANRVASHWIANSYLGIAIDGSMKILGLTLTLNIVFALFMQWTVKAVNNLLLKNLKA